MSIALCADFAALYSPINLGGASRAFKLVIYDSRESVSTIGSSSHIVDRGLLGKKTMVVP